LNAGCTHARSHTCRVACRFVLVMVAHGKTKAETRDDLDAFLGDNAHRFTTW
jgi:hypothetical protein